MKQYYLQTDFSKWNPYDVYIGTPMKIWILDIASKIML